DGIRDDLVTGVQTCALPILTLAYGCDFMQREVPVADPWPTTNSSWRIAKGTQRNSIVGEQRGIEPITAILTRILRFEGSGLVRLARQFKIKTVHLLDVILRGYADRETCLNSNDTREVPPVRYFSRKAVVPRRWQLPDVTQHETMPGIKLRKRAAAAGIQRIQ